MRARTESDMLLSSGASLDDNRNAITDLRTIHRAKRLQAMLVISMVFAPFTALRVGIAGICEASAIFLFVGLFWWKFKIPAKGRVARFPFTIFWCTFSASTVLGMVYNRLFIDPSSGLLSSALFNLASYIFVSICCFSLEYAIVSINNKRWSEEALRKIFLILTMVMTVLWIVSRFRPSLFGLRLRYYMYFVPLAKNLHHVSMVMAPMPFIGLWCMSREKSVFRKLILIILSIWVCIMGLQIGSSKILLGQAFGLVILLFSWLFRMWEKRDSAHIIYVSIVTLALFIALLPSIGKLLQSANDLFISMDGGGGREEIYSEAIPKILQSPLFGFGPGGHIYRPWMAPRNSIWWDAHQSYLGAYLQGGIIGFLSLVFITLFAMSRMFRDMNMLAAAGTIFIYAAGGDIIRRLPCWLFLILFIDVSSRGVEHNSDKGDKTLEAI